MEPVYEYRLSSTVAWFHCGSKGWGIFVTKAVLRKDCSIEHLYVN